MKTIAKACFSNPYVSGTVTLVLARGSYAVLTSYESCDKTLTRVRSVPLRNSARASEQAMRLFELQCKHTKAVSDHHAAAVSAA